MYTIACDFDGANCRVVELTEDTAYVDVELRDTIGDWFYWCFRVEGAAGRTITFRFPSTCRVGYFGAAVSHDYETWRWQYTDRCHEGDCFTYTFGEEENNVWFAHDMLYRPARFAAFAAAQGLEVKSLCVSERGREVPYIDTEGEGETILLTARHHACEATGNYVLEGVLAALLNDPVFSAYRIVCVPFVDFDGVIDGDQGKNRAGHDHNRDYDPDAAARYASVAALRELATRQRLRFAFDFHSPWHLGGRNDTMFIPMKFDGEAAERIARFSRLWEAEIDVTPAALPHIASEDMPAGVEWNTFGAPCFGTYMGRHAGAELSFTVETPYFAAHETPFTPAGANAAGTCFVQALKEYIKNKKAVE